MPSNDISARLTVLECWGKGQLAANSGETSWGKGQLAANSGETNRTEMNG